MLCDTPQGVSADVTFADVPVAIDARIILRARVVEVNCPNTLNAHRLLHALNQRLKPVSLANVITRCKRVRRVEANTER